MRLFVSGLFLSFCIVLAACGGQTANNASNTPANTANNTARAATPQPAATIDELASGRKLFSVNCAGCHKEDGTGGETEFEGQKINADDLTSDKIKGFSDEKIIGYIVKGIPDEGMPAFKDKLSEGEIRDVVKFVRVELQKVPGAAKANSNGAALQN